MVKGFLVVLLLFLPTAEVATRIFIPQVNLSYTAYHSLGFPIMVPNLNDTVGVIPEATSIRGSWVRSYAVKVKTNSVGQRNDHDFSFEKPLHKKRILSLGGSIAFGWPFESKDSYPQILETLLPQTEVINAAVIGTSPAHILEYYEKLGSKYRPDVVLVQLRPSALLIDDLIQDSLGVDSLEIEWLRENGFADWVEQNKISDGAGNFRVPIESLKVEEKINQRLRGGGNIEQFLYAHSHFVRLLKSRGFWFSDSTFFKNYLAHQSNLRELNSENSKEFASRSFAATENYLTQLKKLTDQDKAKLILLVTPNKFGCDAEVLQPWKNLLSHLHQKNFETLSFVADFCDLDKFAPREDTFLADETHPTQKMYRLIAEKIARHFF